MQYLYSSILGIILGWLLYQVAVLSSFIDGNNTIQMLMPGVAIRMSARLAPPSGGSSPSAQMGRSKSGPIGLIGSTVAPPADETPAERANKLGEVLPPARKPAHRLVQEYQVATFSTRPANLEIAQEAGSEVRKLSIKAYSNRLISRLLQRLRRFQR